MPKIALALTPLMLIALACGESKEDRSVTNSRLYTAAVAQLSEDSLLDLCSKTGQSNCLATGQFKATEQLYEPCTEIGQTHCITTKAIPAAPSSTDSSPSASTSQEDAPYQDCTADAQINCIATSNFRAANMAAFDSDDISTGRTIAGIAGSGTLETHSSCSGNAEIGCVTTLSWQSADLSNLSTGNIKKGIAIAGVTGNYPSATYRLPNADTGGAENLKSTTFSSSLSSANTFEYWDENGDRHTGTGDTDLSAENIDANIEIFGITGQIKTACRSAINSSVYNSDASPPGNLGTTAGVLNDWWDSIDDYGNGTFPSSVPIGWDDYLCDASLWTDETSDGLCDSAGDECIYKSSLNKLSWSEEQGAGKWSEAIDGCELLSFGGFSDWRLPTLKEWMEAYVHGILDLSSNADFMPNLSDEKWTSTTNSTSTNQAWRIQFDDSHMLSSRSKNNSKGYHCVR